MTPSSTKKNANPNYDIQITSRVPSTLIQTKWKKNKSKTTGSPPRTRLCAMIAAVSHSACNGFAPVFIPIMKCACTASAATSAQRPKQKGWKSSLIWAVVFVRAVGAKTHTVNVSRRGKSVTLRCARVRTATTDCRFTTWSSTSTSKNTSSTVRGQKNWLKKKATQP